MVARVNVCDMVHVLVLSLRCDVNVLALVMVNIKLICNLRCLSITDPV